MTKTKTVEEMFEAGAHYGYSKSRRHPSVTPFIFGTKDRVEIFDLEKVNDLLEKAKDFAQNVAAQGKQILFVGGKQQSQKIIREVAEKLDQPYVAGRWIGGTLTNFPEIRRRVDHFTNLSEKRDKGLLTQYTKKERLLIDREIEKLDKKYAGITNMKQKPAAVFVIDSNQEKIAVAEAKKERVPVISLASSDCDISKIEYPIVANDSSVKSIEFFVNQIAEAVQEGSKKSK